MNRHEGTRLKEKYLKEVVPVMTTEFGIKNVTAVPKITKVVLNMGIGEAAKNKATIDEELCTGCGICIKRCPFQAIQIINLPQEFKLTPLHQYGKNSFRLYRLPIPKFNQITGIIGKNGIGKTTTLEILSGNLIPNLNQENKNYNKVIEFFKGTEAQAYFEKLKNKKLKIAYKPQLIDKIPEYFKGKVIDLLKKVDEKKQLKEISKKLELENTLNNNISEISGGELQRVAIAATLLKEANIYFFDEPTSYLDIKQRMFFNRNCLLVRYMQ